MIDHLSLKRFPPQHLLFYHQPFHWIGNIGKSRNGPFDIGSPIWLDWDNEFKDDLNFPQIVGHTTSKRNLRNKGNSWCLDCLQTYYGVIENNKLIVKDETNNFEIIKEI